MTTMTKEEFEAVFHSRTAAYLPGFTHAALPVMVVVGAAAHSPAGHALLVALANQLARTHPQVVFVGDLGQPLLCRDIFGARTLAEATAGLARRINPFIEVEVTSTMPGLEPLLTCGVGTDRHVDLALGCNGWKALLGVGARVKVDELSTWGALLASCLGANAALRRALGVRQLPTGSYSLWDRCRYDGRQGPRDAGPVDVGRVLQAGAGAVGCGLGFFISFHGIGGAWTIVDGDVVDISNLNRQLLFTARDAGFPDSEQIKKAIRMAQLLGHTVSASPRWYGEDAGAVDASYDVVLALANDRGVRSSLQGRQPTVLLHATTSRSWEAQLHRHVAGRDDCIDCRLPPQAARFTCAEGEFQAPEGDRVDAALPPLSATAGLLLAAELKRLELGALVEGARNFTAVGLSSLTPTVQRKMYRCTLGCRSRRPPAVRQMIDADSRWLHLDGDGAASR